MEFINRTKLFVSSTADTVTDFIKNTSDTTQDKLQKTAQSISDINITDGIRY